MLREAMEGIGEISHKTAEALWSNGIRLLHKKTAI
jgi:hypothetical protein